jgi:hypothetical protein
MGTSQWTNGHHWHVIWHMPFDLFSLPDLVVGLVLAHLFIYRVDSQPESSKFLPSPSRQADIDGYHQSYLSCNPGRQAKDQKYVCWSRTSPCVWWSHLALAVDEDIWTLILQSLALPDLLTVGWTCHTMRQFVDRVSCRWLLCIIQPWTLGHAVSFLAVCETTNCLMTGSCARAMFTGDIGHLCRDLNLLCGQDSFALMHTFLMESLGFVLLCENCHPTLQYSVAECRQYTKAEGLITLSTPKPGMHLLHVIVSAPSTADMVFMNGRGLGCFYAQWSQDGISVVTHTGHLGLWTTKIGCAGNSMHSFQIQQDTHFLGQPCGNLCPTLWHHVDSSPHFLAFNWTPHSSIKTVVEDVGIEWCLNSYCLNSACPHNVKVMAGNYECAGSQTGTFVWPTVTSMPLRRTNPSW